MDSNAFLLSFGMKPEDFDRTEGPIESDDGFVYEAWEARKSPGVGEERVRGRAEQRKDGSRERCCPRHDRRRVRVP